MFRLIRSFRLTRACLLFILTPFHYHLIHVLLSLCSVGISMLTLTRDLINQIAAHEPTIDWTGIDGGILVARVALERRITDSVKR